MRALVALAIVASACKGAESTPAAESAPTPADREPAASSADPAKPTTGEPGTVPRSPPSLYRIHWSNVKATDNCFFFSGPDGRDDQLVGEVRVETVELEGSALRIRIGTALFEGTLVSGSLDLVRDSTHEFGGTWSTHETLRGRLIEDELRATYRYEECEPAARDCPGRCTIDADVAIRR